MLYETLRFLKRLFFKPIYNLLQYRLIDKRKYDLYKNNYEILKTLVDIRNLKCANGIQRQIQLKNYQFTKEIISELEQNGIQPFMIAGTLLGAERHKGFIPWDDDIDFGVIREDYNKILEYANKHFIVCYHNINRYNWAKSAKKHIENLLKQYPNKTLLLVSSLMYKFIRGTSLSDYVQMDLFAFDYYKEDYKYSDFVKKSIKNIGKLWEINNTPKEIEFLKKQRENDPNVVKQSSKIFYGNDNMDAQTRETLAKCSDFMKTSDFFPLKRMQFEDTKFWAPNNHIQYLENYIGKNWCSIPDNITPPHINEREE